MAKGFTFGRTARRRARVERKIGAGNRVEYSDADYVLFLVWIFGATVLFFLTKIFS